MVFDRIEEPKVRGDEGIESIKLKINTNIPGDPIKSIPLL